LNYKYVTNQKLRITLLWENGRSLIDAKDLQVTVIKEIEMKTQS